MKILVTGAKGQLGSALCRLGTKSKFEIIGLDSSTLDISQPAEIASALTRLQPDFLINAAAYTAVDKAESEPERATLINGLAVSYLAKEAAMRHIPLVHVSTDYVFDGRKITPYRETDPVAPLGVYGRSKLEGEQLIQKSHAQSIVLRTSWVFGLEGKNFPKTILRLAQEKSEIGIVADQFGCPTFADDIAKALLAMASMYHIKRNLPWGIYHYAGREACSWYDFANFIIDSAQKKGTIKVKPHLKPLTTAEYPTAALRPANSVLDCEKFCRAFPEVPLSEWRAGVEALLQPNNSQG